MYRQVHRILSCQSFIKSHQSFLVKHYKKHNENHLLVQCTHTVSAFNKTNTKENKPVSKTNIYTVRSHTCGELNASNVDQRVVLCGWLQFQRLSLFAILRDGYGQVQVIIPNDRPDLSSILSDITFESVLQITGIVVRRPEDQILNNSPTGEIEVIASEVNVLNKADSNIPFLIRNHNKAKEDLRLKHRYLDFRFPEMQHNLRFRSNFLMRAREFLINHRDFVEVETPTLFKRTPGGAREFVVPTHDKDKFYSLVQSPQQLKQLLMVGSMDRYFQVARCYRDESTRPDRQPEFTQLDIELSFTTRDSVMLLIEQLLCYCLNLPHRPFPRMTYQDAMQHYGSDKPDLRYQCKIKNLDNYLPDTARSSESPTHRVLILPNPAVPFSNKTLSQYKDLAKTKHNSVKVTAVRLETIAKLLKVVPDLRLEDFVRDENVKEDDVIVMAWGNQLDVLSLLGEIRAEAHRPATCSPLDLEDPTSFHISWVVDFPLFLPSEDGSLESAHHPFTLPHPEDEHLLANHPLQVRGLHYDLVLNGCEVGGGSMRIHDAQLQEMILSLLHIDTSSLQHMLQAFKYGCPPHGGIALGIDRLMSILCGTQSIRDVIAFPKGFGGKDHMSGAPCDISKEEKEYYFL